MTGLLQKDLCLFMKYCKIFLIFLVVDAFIPFAGEESVFMIFYPAMMFGLIPFTLLSYDERAGWHIFAETLPVSRSQIVSVKYIISLIFLSSILVVSLIAQTVYGFIHHSFDYSLVFVQLSMGLIAPSVLLPTSFRFGTEKGRIIYYIIIGAFCAVSVFLSDFFGSLSAMTAGISFFLIPALAPVLFAASWLLSIHFYKKRRL